MEEMQSIYDTINNIVPFMMMFVYLPLFAWTLNQKEQDNEVQETRTKE
ncbi:hypothetical protein [Helicobacter cetorum]|nr:hypothetical protein [Helicobacter cetorum]